MKKICNMMSFDTSSTSSGWALFKNAKLSKYDTVLHKEKEVDLFQKMDLMIVDLLALLETYKPLIVVIERPPYKNDPKTLTALSEIIGAVRAWSILNKADYVEYTPSQWRKLVKDEDEKLPTDRNELKVWDIEKVRKLYGIENIGDDPADSILIGQARINEVNEWIDSGYAVEIDEEVA